MRDRVSVDTLTLVSGAAIAALGLLVLLDSSGALDFSVGWMAVALTAAVGSMLLAGGLTDDGRDRHD